MAQNDKIQLFEDKRIRTAWDEEKEEWYFSIVDVCEVLSGTDNPRRYWSDLKRKLKSEGAVELYEKIVQLKMTAPDGKKRLTDVADTEQLLLPSVDVDAYLAKLVGPSFKMNHKTFEMEDMTVEFDETTQCYKIPVTGSVGSYSATVTKLFKKDGLLHVTVGYIPTQSTDDSILNTLSDTPTKYMDYLFRRQNGSWYLTGLTDSETKPESTAAAASEPAPMAESEVQDAILAAAGDSAVSSEEAAPAESADSTPAESAPAADSTAAESTAASGEAASESTAA